MKKGIPSCALVITTYNWPEALNLSLRSVFKQTQLPDEIIVADDGSTNETAKLIESISKEFNYPIKHCWQEDIGFRAARSRNNAIIASNSEYLIFIDGDIILHRHFIQDHLRVANVGYFTNGSRVILLPDLSNKLFKGEVKNIGWRLWFQKNSLNGIRIPLLHKFIKGSQNAMSSIKSCNMAFWYNDLIAVNGFDEKYVGWGREDSDLAARLMHNGVKRKNVKFSAIIFHLYHKTQSQDQLVVNDELVKRTIKSKSIRASIGIEEHGI